MFLTVTVMTLCILTLVHPSSFYCVYYCTHNLTQKKPKKPEIFELTAIASLHSYVKINGVFGTADVNSNEVMLCFFFSLQKQELSKTDYAF